MAAEQLELAAIQASASAMPVDTDPPDFYNLIASERGMPAGWRWYSLEAKPSVWSGKPPPRSQAFVIVRGAVCTTKYQSGPHKGQTNWNKRDKSTDTEIVIRLDEFDARRAQWARDTGRCCHCGGRGHETASYDAKTGVTTTRPCHSCKGSGKPTP